MFVPLKLPSTSGRPPPAPSAAQGSCSVCGHFRVSPEPVLAPRPGRTVPPAGLSASPVTGTGNAPASPSGSSGPAPKKESHIQRFTTKHNIKTDLILNSGSIKG